MSIIGSLDLSKSADIVAPAEPSIIFRGITDDKLLENPVGKVAGISAEISRYVGWLMASDMDGTLTQSDLGLSVLLAKFSDIGYWKRTSWSEFQNAFMIPDVQMLLQYENGVSSLGKEGDSLYIADVPQTLYYIQFTVLPEIFQLFRCVKEKVSHDENFLNTPEFNRFLDLNILIDALFMKLEPVVSELLEGRIITRTRLLAGSQPDYVAKLVGRIIRTTKEANQARETSVIEGLPDCITLTESLKVWNGVAKVVAVRRFLRDMLFKHINSGLYVVTTNLPENAQALMDTGDGPYTKITNQAVENMRTTLNRSNLTVRDLVHGTSLEKVLGVYDHNLVSRGVLKDQKRDRVEKLNSLLPVTVALGDTMTDTGMMEFVLNRGGVAILVGSNANAIKSTFERFLDSLPARQLERVFYATY